MVPLNIGFKRKAIEDLSEAILCKRDSRGQGAGGVTMVLPLERELPVSTSARPSLPIPASARRSWVCHLVLASLIALILLLFLLFVPEVASVLGR